MTFTQRLKRGSTPNQSPASGFRRPVTDSDTFQVRPFDHSDDEICSYLPLIDGPVVLRSSSYLHTRVDHCRVNVMASNHTVVEHGNDLSIRFE